MTRNFKLTTIFCLLIASALLWGSCKKDKNSSFNIDAQAQFTTFSINNIAAQINQQTGQIQVNLPFGTDLTALMPVFDLPEQAIANPAAGQMLNMTGSVAYRITNGNVYKDYTVVARILPPLVSFSINDVPGIIDQESKSISLILPDGADLSNLKPVIELQGEVQISPLAGVAQDFSKPVAYTITKGNLSVVYQVNVISNSISEYAFLGLAASRASINNPDEKAAADWFFTNYPTAEYVSFQSIESGRRLANYRVIWWHFDSAQDLPAAALSTTVTNSLKAYRAAGGSLLLTTYAARYVEALGVVPAGRGPNNVFGDFGETAGFIEANNNWGISFRTQENHPIFQGLETYEPGKAWLLQKGTFRKNHTAWWFVNEWGGYGNGAGWRAQTGGVNLASENWDDTLDGRVGIAEWPSATAGNVVIVAFGAYDWYSEPIGGGTTNLYLSNIKKITKNAIDYLKN
jgi:hypothetical protein